MKHAGLKIFTSLFFSSYLLNFVWENLHAQLYVHYKGGPITEKILLQATLVDAVIISCIALPFLFLSRLHKRVWLASILWILIAIGIEWFALTTDRWSYKDTMPIIPLLRTGLTPTIQLALLGTITIITTKRLYGERLQHEYTNRA